MRNWVAVLKAFYDADDYADALAIAEVIRQNAERELEHESDSADVALVLPLGIDDTRAELVTLLRRARNALIRLGHQRSVDVAREVDMIAEIVSNPSASLDHHAPYNYGRFMDILAMVTEGKDPGV